MIANSNMANENRFSGHPWKLHEAEFQEWIALVTGEPRGTKAELDAVVEKFYPAVVKSAAGIISSPSFRWLRLRGEDIANSWYIDLVQRGFKGYDRGRPFYPYGHKLLVRKCLNTRRRETLRQVKTGNERVSREDGPDKIADTREQIGRLKEKFRGLEKEEREALLRKYFAEEKSKKIAGDFGMTEGRFNQWTFEIRNKLRNRLEDDERRESA
jgi:RNA polymerase sigma factor (sigma-70 family)